MWAIIKRKATHMFDWLKNLRKPTVKKIAFIDGDQDIPSIISVYQQHLVGIETHLVRLMPEGDQEPKLLRRVRGFNKVYLHDMSSGKEVVDKFIGAYIQKAVDEGYNHISVVSNDYDFIDIFKMITKLNPSKELTFRIIVPRGQGKIRKTQTTVKIEVVHVTQ